jgi:hypothetical protein
VLVIGKSENHKAVFETIDVALVMKLWEFDCAHGARRSRDLKEKTDYLSSWK